MSHTSNVLDGLARLIADAGIAVYRPDGLYAADEVAIVIGAVPDRPDNLIALTPYTVDDAGGTEDVTEAVQVRYRAGTDPRAALDRADAVFDLLTMRVHTDLSGVHAGVIWRQSQAWIGPDTADRQEITANYYMRTIRPAPHLIET